MKSFLLFLFISNVTGTLTTPPVELLLKMITSHFYSEQFTYLRLKYYLLISQLTCLYFLKTLAGEAIERNYFDKNQQVVQEEEGEEEGSTEVKATKVAEVWPQRQPSTVC